MKPAFNKKAFIIAIIIAVVGVSVLAWVVYWGLVDPIREKYYEPLATPITGAQYYEEEAYLDLPKGNEFKKAIEQFDYLLKGEITDFYYIDNSNKDNPIYGKIADTYAIEVQYDTESFAQVKESIIQVGEDNSNIGYYLYYLLPYEDSCYKLFAFHEEKKIVRFIMITDIEQNINVPSYLCGFTHLNWD